MQKKRETYIRNLVTRFENERAAGKSSYFDAEDFEDIVVHYFEEADYEKARDVLRCAESIHPGNQALILRKAELFINLQEPEKALPLLESLPNDEDTAIVRASAFLDTGKQKEAIDMMWQLVHRCKGERDLLCLDIADNLTARNLWEEALKVIKTVLDDYPHNKELYTKAVDCCIGMNDLAASEPYLEHLLDEDPYDIRSWAQLGECHYNAGRYDKALEAYEFAMAASSGQPDYLLYILMGHTLAQMGAYEKAMSYYTRSIPFLQTDTEKNEVLGCMGEACEKLEQWETAISFYEKALASFPFDEQAFLGIGVCHLELSHWPEAMNAFDRVLQLNPENEDIWTCIGDLYVDTKQFDEAISAYERAVQIKPDQPEVYLALGHLHFESDRLSTALQYYEKAAGYNPELPHIFVYQALCLQFLNRKDECRKALEEAMAHDADAADFYRSLFNA